MTILAIVGGIVITMVLFWATVWLFGGLYFQHAIAGLNCLDWRDWLFLAGVAAILVLGWWGWWELFGSLNIDVSIGRTT